MEASQQNGLRTYNILNTEASIFPKFPTQLIVKVMDI